MYIIKMHGELLPLFIYLIFITDGAYDLFQIVSIFFIVGMFLKLNHLIFDLPQDLSFFLEDQLSANIH